MSTENTAPYFVDGYLPTIGIECHVQLKTKTKLFAAIDNNARDAAPNTLISHICFGLPGALPVLNEHAVELAAKAAFALGTTPQKFSKFDRKHYFYPDLPKGYQITQFEEPIILGGEITIQLENGQEKVIHITRAHMEEDAGKSTHPTGADYSLVDLNRAGTPLLEIVSEPEIHTPAEAKAYAKELWLRMKYAGVSDVDLYHGNMRFDVNVSVSKDPTVLGTRTETKNLNSFKSVERAVAYEIKRQIALLERGEKIVQETRGWLDDSQKTFSQRSKEDAHDYRYFPEPDVPPIVLDEAFIAGLQADLPTMPQAWREQLRALAIDPSQTEVLLEAQVEFETEFLALVASQSKEQAKVLVNSMTNVEIPLLRTMKLAGTSLPSYTQEERSRIYTEVTDLAAKGIISSNGVKSLLEDLLQIEKLPDNIMQFSEDKGYNQLTDSGEMEAFITTVLEKNPAAVTDIQNGELKAIGFLVGQVMQLSKGKANPAEVKKMITDKLQP